MVKHMLELFKNNFVSIYGEAGTGKTTLSLIIAINKLKNNEKVIFLDTENSFSVERFKQLANNNLGLLDNLILIKAKNFKEQQEKIRLIKDLAKKTKISLIIIDTLSPHYKRLVKHNPDLANSMLNSQVRILKETNIPLIITNQVYSNMNGSTKLIAENIIKNYCDDLIKLQKNPRKIIINSNKEISFEIKNDGVYFISE
ncbi:MAG: ATPase domain-containing protein [Nanoarchaeota archaeon]